MAVLTAGLAWAEADILPEDVYVEILERAGVAESDIEKYAQIFELIEKGDFTKADEKLAELDNRVIRGHVLAEKYLHPKYKSSVTELEEWLTQYAELPQAARIYKLAQRKGARDLQEPVYAGSSEVSSGKISRKYLDRLGKADRRFLVRQAQSFRTYIRRGKTLPARHILENKRFQRLAPKPYWDSLAATLSMKYLVDNYDAKALEWGIKASKRHNSGMATWVAGLASWRLKKYEAAASYFARLGSSKNPDEWLMAAGAFWSARAYDKLGNHLKAREMLKLAARHKYTFYGILAAYQLGEKPDYAFDRNNYINDFDTEECLDEIASSEALVRAVALLAAGRRGLAADEFFAAYDGLNDKQKEAVIVLASRSGLHALVIAISKQKDLESLSGNYEKEIYPLPRWSEDNKWLVDKALVLAMIRQESAFRRTATSRSGARGLMQLMPNTAYHISGDKSIKRNKDKLFDLDYNLKLGQQYISYLLAKPFIEGNLFFMLTAYNGGPGNLVKWQKGARYDDDPLMFIEVLPSAETRIYIERVMANYWIYNLRLEAENKTLEQVAAGEWPVVVTEEAFLFD